MTNVLQERRDLAAQGLDIAWRSTWGSRCDYASDRPVLRARWLFLHIAVVDDPSDLKGDEHQVMRNIEAIGEARFGIGMSYNAAAFDTGRLYEGQPLTRRGAHTVNDLPNPRFPEGSLNHTARALVLPQQVDDDVTDAQIEAAARWGAAVCRAGYANRGAQWFGHRDVTRKSCPGDAAYGRLAELNRLTNHYDIHGLPGAIAQPTEDEDMALVIKAAGEPTRLKDGPTFIRIGAETQRRAKDIGIKTLELEPDEYASMRKQVELDLD